MQPCLTPRRLMMFPKLENRLDVETPLTVKPELAAHLHPMFANGAASLLLQPRPTLWKASDHLNIGFVAKMCFAAMMLCMKEELVAIAHWMFFVSSQQRAIVKASATANPSYRLDVVSWWRSKQREPGWATLPYEEKMQVHALAALHLFTTPPLSIGHKMGAIACPAADADMVVLARSTGHIRWKRDKHGHQGYPMLVLQSACPWAKAVEVPCHQLVAHIFLGPKDSNDQVVCHFDGPNVDSKVQWEEMPQPCPHDKLMHMYPHPSRCGSHGCVNPLCLHYNTQRSNAKSGSMMVNIKNRKRKHNMVAKKPLYPAVHGEGVEMVGPSSLMLP